MRRKKEGWRRRLARQLRRWATRLSPPVHRYEEVSPREVRHTTVSITGDLPLTNTFPASEDDGSVLFTGPVAESDAER